MEGLRRFIDIVFKGLGIAFILAVVVFVSIMFKSCSNTLEVMDHAKSEVLKK